MTAHPNVGCPPEPEMTLTVGRRTDEPDKAALDSAGGEGAGVASLPQGRASMGQTYTFVALTADGRSPFLDVRVLEPDQDPAIHARTLLDEHRSCTRVEVWDGHARLLVIGLDPADLDGAVLD